jgi:hypothetical protein
VEPIRRPYCGFTFCRFTGTYFSPQIAFPMMDCIDSSSWKTPPWLLDCRNPECESCSFMDRSDISFRANATVPFMVDGICNLCDSSFTVCTACPFARGQYLDVTSIRRHCTNQHGEWFRDNLAQRPQRKRGASPASRSPVVGDSPATRSEVRATSRGPTEIETASSDAEMSCDDGFVVDSWDERQ